MVSSTDVEWNQNPLSAQLTQSYCLLISRMAFGRFWKTTDQKKHDKSLKNKIRETKISKLSNFDWSGTGFVGRQPRFYWMFVDSFWCASWMFLVGSRKGDTWCRCQDQATSMGIQRIETNGFTRADGCQAWFVRCLSIFDWINDVLHGIESLDRRGNHHYSIWQRQSKCCKEKKKSKNYVLRLTCW